MIGWQDDQPMCWSASSDRTLKKWDCAHSSPHLSHAALPADALAGASFPATAPPPLLKKVRGHNDPVTCFAMGPPILLSASGSRVQAVHMHLSEPVVRTPAIRLVNAKPEKISAMCPGRLLGVFFIGTDDGNIRICR